MTITRKQNLDKPAQDLESAIHELSTFDQNPKQTKIKKSLKQVVRDFLFERARNEKKIQQAADTVRKYYPLIEKFKEGTNKEEQNLASFALETIQKYNKQIEYRRHTSFTKKAASFIFKKLGIEKSLGKIALPIYATFSTGNKPSFVFSKAQGDNPTKSEQDMFKMKAIILLNLPGKILDSISFQPESQKAENNIVCFGQKLNLLPGEEIELTGQFKRIANNLERSIPLLDTFGLQGTSHQTGFPHPMQENGFAFSEALLPYSPLRPENLPLFYKLHKKKEEAAIALLPKGRFNQSAKNTLILKKQAFNANRDEFLNLHHDLALSFCCLDELPNTYDIDPFFQQAKEAEDPYSFISAAYEKYNLIFIKKAKQHLYENCILTKDELIESYQRYVSRERDALNDNFILFLSKVFENQVLALLLQEISEAALIAPPLLKDSDKTVQAVLFNQLASFLNELENPPQTEQEAQNLMKKSLQRDIDLFSNQKEKPVSLLNELELYYLMRHKDRITSKHLPASKTQA